MQQAVRPRRSVLYMPGSNPRALEKGRGLPADVLVLDLEDAVAPDRKADARGQVRAALAAGGYGRRELVLRVNGLDTPWGGEDLEAAAGMGVDAVLLPKVGAAADVQRAAARLADAGARDGLAIWCMIETPAGILHVEEIATADPRVACLVMGTSDLAKDMHARHTRLRLPFLTGLSLCVLAARAHGLAILDGVHLDLDDDEGFAEQCRQGLELGFDGKTLIHPKTIATANAVFAPSEDEIAWARRITVAFAAAQREGQGVVLVDGRLVETLHVEEAKATLALAEAIAALERDAAPR